MSDRNQCKMPLNLIAAIGRQADSFPCILFLPRLLFLPSLPSPSLIAVIQKLLYNWLCQQSYVQNLHAYSHLAGAESNLD